jgi:hypothetical protein
MSIKFISIKLVLKIKIKLKLVNLEKMGLSGI